MMVKIRWEIGQRRVAAIGRAIGGNLSCSERRLRSSASKVTRDAEGWARDEFSDGLAEPPQLSWFPPLFNPIDTAGCDIPFKT